MGPTVGREGDQFAGLRLVRAIERSPVGERWLAAPEPGGPTRVVVTSRAEPTLAGPAGPYERVARFFASYARQRRVALAASGPVAAGPVQGAGDGSGHVAVVHDLGATEFGGYAVLDRYPLTAQDLVDGRVRPPAHVLYQVMAGVASALAAVREVDRGRAHGGLTAATVYLDGTGGPGRWRVGLGGLAPVAEVDANPKAALHGDVRAIGRLLYELVEHRAFRELGGYPVRDDGEWSAIGESGAAWLRLANRLLDPDARPGSTKLEEAAAEIAALRATPPKTGQRVAAISAAGTLAVVGIGVGLTAWLTYKPPPPPARFNEANFERWCRAYDDWYGPLLEPRGELRRAIESAGQRDGHVLRVLEELDRMRRGSDFEVRPLSAVPREIAGRRSRASELLEVLAQGDDAALKLRANDRLGGVVNANIELIDAVVSGFSAESWPARSRLLDRADQFEALGLGEVAGALRAVSAEVTPQEGLDLAQEIGAVFEALDAAEAFDDEVWAPLGISLAAIEAAGLAVAHGPGDLDPEDPALLAAPAAVRAAVATPLVESAQPDATGAIGAATAQIMGVRPLVDRLAAFTGPGGGWSRVDREAFSGGSSVLAGLRATGVDGGGGVGGVGSAGVTVATLEAWLAEAEQKRFALPDPEEDPRRGEAYAAALSSLESVTATLAELRRDYSSSLQERMPELDGVFAPLGVDGELAAVRALASGIDPDAARWKRSNVERITADATRLAQRATRLNGAVSAVANEIRVRWEDVVAELESGVPPRGTVTAAAAAVWPRLGAGMIEAGGALAERDRTRAAVELNGRKKAATAVLIEIEAGLLGVGLGDMDPAAGGAPSGMDRAAIEARLEERIEGAVAEAIEAAGWGGAEFAGGTAFRSTLDGLIGRERAWVASIQRCAADLALFERLSDAGYLPQEPGPGGGTIAGVIGAWADGGGLEDWGLVRGAMGGAATAIERAAAVAGVGAGATEAGVLLGVALDESASLGLRRSAYERLGASGQWPKTAEALAQDAEASAKLSARVAVLSALADPAALSAQRSREISAWLSQTGRARWLGAMGWAADAGAVEAVLDQMAAYGIEAQSLEGPARWNAELWALAGDEAARDARAAEDVVRPVIKARAQRVAAALAGLSGDGVGGDGAGGRAAWVEKLRVLGEVPADRRPTFIPEEAGPGRVEGWVFDAGASSEDLTALVYRHPGLGVEARFVHVDRSDEPGVDGVYMLDREVSLGLFRRVMGDAAISGMLERNDNLVQWSQLRDPAGVWIGPRVWTFDPVGGMAANASWLQPNEWIEGNPLLNRPAIPAYPEALREPGARPPIRINRQQGEPTDEHPMNVVPVLAAREMARRMGVWLPTSAEWRAAYRRFAQGRPQESWNLRDQTWRAQWAWINGEEVMRLRELNAGNQPIASVRVPRPGDGHIQVRGVAGFTRELEQEGDALPIDDARLWFDPAGFSRDARASVHGLVGNLWEWVVDGAAPDATDQAYIGAARVIGGSALSHPSLAVDQPYAVNFNNLAGGTADVGFRVSFPGDPNLPLGRRLDRLIAREGLPYVLSAEGGG